MEQQFKERIGREAGGLDAASKFPAIFMGIFSNRMNKLGGDCMDGDGACFHVFQHRLVQALAASDIWALELADWDIARGIGVIGMPLNFAVAIPGQE